MDIPVGDKGLMRFIIMEQNWRLVGWFDDKQATMRKAADLAEVNGREYCVWEMIASYSPATVDPSDAEYEAGKGA